MATQGIISNGPSKFDLMLGLFDGEFTNRREIDFTITDEGDDLAYKSRIVINGLKRENSDSESWLFEGWCTANAIRFSSKVSGHYSTKTRKGQIEYGE
jgi:hypothetical protein